MTIAHAAEIHFGGKRESAKKRIQRLKAAGFVKERSRKPYEPSILHLASKGVTSLSERGILTEYPSLSRTAIERRNRVSELTLRHELQVMDVKAAIYKAVRASPEIEIERFCTWPHLCEIGGGGKAWSQIAWIARPDGFLRFRRDRRLHCIFLELDRSTESQGTLLAKAKRYASYQASEPGRKPATIHFIFSTDARKRNAELTFAKSPLSGRIRIRSSTLEEVLSWPLKLVS